MNSFWELWASVHKNNNNKKRVILNSISSCSTELINYKLYSRHLFERASSIKASRLLTASKNTLAWFQTLCSWIAPSDVVSFGNTHQRQEPNKPIGTNKHQKRTFTYGYSMGKCAADTYYPLTPASESDFAAIMANCELDKHQQQNNTPNYTEQTRARALCKSRAFRLKFSAKRRTSVAL